MARVEEAGTVVGDGELLDAGDVVRVFDGDGGVVGEDVQKGDGVVGHLSERGLKISMTPWVPLRPRSGNAMTDRTRRARLDLTSCEAGIFAGFRDDEGFAVLGDPAGDDLRRP